MLDACDDEGGFGFVEEMPGFGRVFWKVNNDEVGTDS